MLNSTTTCAGTDVAGIIAQTCSTTYQESSSTDQTFVNGFTAGELVLSVMIFLILVSAMILTYHVIFRRVKIRNQ